MDINVLKFGGSSVANNTNLNIVAKKIISFKRKGKDLVVIVSAQGKTTDNLINEAKELSAYPEKRELDALINVGEQITASKLAILLNRKGYRSISLNGWQAGIKTNSDFNEAKILEIDSSAIMNNLSEGKIVIVTGFQGIDKNNNITTLGRGGSDTSAVAIASVLNASKCYIFSDVDGVYTADPNKVTEAKKLNQMSFKEMQLASNAGAKVLHDRCVELAEKYNTTIIAASTFNNKNEGTIICDSSDKLEQNPIKSIVKNDDILLVTTIFNKKEEVFPFIKKLIKAEIKIGYYRINDKQATFSILSKDRNNLINLTETIDVKTKVEQTSKVSIIGTGISNNFDLIEKVIEILSPMNNEIFYFDLSSYKISVQFREIIDDKYLRMLHDKLL